MKTIRYAVAAGAAAALMCPAGGASGVVIGELATLYQEPTAGRVMNSGSVAMLRAQFSCENGYKAYMRATLGWSVDGAPAAAEGQTDLFSCSGAKQVAWVPVYPIDRNVPIPTGDVWLNGITLFVCSPGSELCDAGLFEGDYRIPMRGSGG